ncbi:hypothetical protein B0J14DRAFT_95916 [Halenospora varia]|nr:hypothetical protein B0J14DRAFT_95916 [Halenospora varia]
MRFTSIITAVGVMASVAIAEPVAVPEANLAPRQNAAQTSAFIAAATSYAAFIDTDPALTTLISKLAANPTEASQVVSWYSSVAVAFLKGSDVGTTAIAALPTVAQPYFASVASVENSILTANGFAVATGTSQAAAPTNGVVAAAGVAAGAFVGLVMAL